MTRAGSLGLLIAIFLISTARPAYAYIDPGGSSMLLQLIVGGLAAVLMLVRRIWQRTIAHVTVPRPQTSKPLHPEADRSSPAESEV